MAATTYMRIVRNWRAAMQIGRRHFLIGASAAACARSLPVLNKLPARRVLTLVYDKSLGMMRAVERVVR